MFEPITVTFLLMFGNVFTEISDAKRIRYIHQSGFSKIGLRFSTLKLILKHPQNIRLSPLFKGVHLYLHHSVAFNCFDRLFFACFRGPNVKVGHYTQLLWSDTTDLGCAASYYTTKTKFANKTRKWHHLLYVCNYGPGGNYITLPVYKVGKPGSKCPGGIKTTKKYPGLCGVNKKINETSRNFEPLFTF